MEVPVLTDFNSGTKGKSPLSLVRLGRVVAPALVTITWFTLLTVRLFCTGVAAAYLASAWSGGSDGGGARTHNLKVGGVYNFEHRFIGTCVGYSQSGTCGGGEVQVRSPDTHRWGLRPGDGLLYLGIINDGERLGGIIRSRIVAVSSLGRAVMVTVPPLCRVRVVPLSEATALSDDA